VGREERAAPHAAREDALDVKLTIRPLTPSLWPALEDLFGANGASNGCWCMYWRIGAAYHKRAREKNRAAFRGVVRRGPPPGLLAFDGAKAVGWCQLTPRDALPWLNRSRLLGRVDDAPVWSLTCFYVRRGYRGRGGRVGADRSGRQRRQARAGAGARGLSGRYGPAEEHVECLHRHGLVVRASRIQDRRASRRGSPHHAPRSSGEPGSP
jgi:hypothetical protein